MSGFFKLLCFVVVKSSWFQMLLAYCRVFLEGAITKFDKEHALFRKEFICNNLIVVQELVGLGN